MALKQSNPDMDPIAYEILKEEIEGLIHEELVQNQALSEMMYPIYPIHFSVEELKQIVEMNETPLEKKMIKIMPVITREGIQAGKILGQSLAPKIQERIISRFQEEGIQ